MRSNHLQGHGKIFMNKRLPKINKYLLSMYYIASTTLDVQQIKMYQTFCDIVTCVFLKKSLVRQDCTLKITGLLGEVWSGNVI